MRAGFGSQDRLHESELVDVLRRTQGTRVDIAEAGSSILRTYDPDDRRLFINAALPSESRQFLLAHHLMKVAADDVIARIVAQAAIPAVGADRLLAVGLANYAAGALMMPYGRFRESARELRHDIDQLARRFGVSFEQACHSL